MEITGDFAFLSKFRLHINIDLGNVRIQIIDAKNEDYEDIKQFFDKLKLMEESQNFQINFKDAELTNKTLSRDIYGGSFQANLNLKSDS